MARPLHEIASAYQQSKDRLAAAQMAVVDAQKDFTRARLAYEEGMRVHREGLPAYSTANTSERLP